MKSLFRIVCCTAIIGFAVNLCHGQSGAGGVGNATNLPMWYDANEINLSDGSQIFQVDDISGNGNHLTQATSANRPVYDENALNGMPAMVFDGVNDYLTRGSTSGLNGSNFSYFIVFRRTLGLSQTFMDVGYTSIPTKWRAYSLSNNNIVNNHVSPTTKSISYLNNNPAPTFTFTKITPTNFRIYQQGSLMKSLNVAYTPAAGHQLIRVGMYNANLLPTGQWLNGEIAEIIVYNTNLNNLEQLIIENYLGAKYNMTIPNDFFAYQASHRVGLVGIGNNGTNSQTTAQGYGIMTLSNPTNLNTNEFLMIAHSGHELDDFTTTGLPPSLPGHQYFTRTWRADETGEVGNVTLTFDLTGGNNFADPTTYNLLVDNDDDFSNATVVPGIYNGINETVTFTLNINAGDFFTVSGLFQSLVINSISSGNWSETSTWDCDCIPGPFDQVFIQPTHSVEVNIAANCLDLEIVAGGELTMNSPNQLNINGNFNSFGTLTPGTGTIAFVGNSNQEFNDLGNGTNFFNLTINNSGGEVLFFASELVLDGTLTLLSGNLNLSQPGMNFIVNSTSSTVGGRIAPITGSGNLIGEISVRRFIPAGDSFWRDVCSPVTGATFADWDPDLEMSGPAFPDGCASGFGDPCWKSVRFTSNGYQNNVLDVNDPISNNRGYYLWMGDDLNSFSGTTLTSTGTIHGSADVVRNMTTGWQTVGNPFVSPILFSELTRTSNVGNYFYIYDNTIGDYQWYDGSDGSFSTPELTNGLLATGQGFWIYMGGAGTLTFHQTSKTSLDATYIRNHSTSESQNLSLILKQEGTTYQTSIILEATSYATDEADSLSDMMYLETGLEAAPRLYMKYSNFNLKKNFIQNDSRNKSFELYSKIKTEGYYSFSLESSNQSFSDYRSILLYDGVTGQFVDLKKEPSYSFYSDVHEGSRFTLILTNLEVVPSVTVEALSANPDDHLLSQQFNIVQMGHVFDINTAMDFIQSSEVSLVNVLGQKTVFTEVIQFVQGSNVIVIPEQIRGVHILVIRTGEEVITKKVVL